MVIGIDPGSTESAFVFLEGKQVRVAKKVDNFKLLACLESKLFDGVAISDVMESDLVIEWIQGYGMAVGQSVFETCRWVGLFEHAWGMDCTLLGRKAVKSHLCNNTGAKDSHVREALIDRFGPPGTKKNPGPLYGVTGDMLSALAVAVTFQDQQGRGMTWQRSD
jgi:hypothetical protein